MSAKVNYINGLYELMQEKFGDRFIGYALPDMGIIEGRIDKRKFSLFCHSWHIKFEITYRNNDLLLSEMSNIIHEYNGNENIRCQYNVTSCERNSEEMDFLLGNRIDEEKGLSYKK